MCGTYCHPAQVIRSPIIDCSCFEYTVLEWDIGIFANKSIRAAATPFYFKKLACCRVFVWDSETSLGSVAEKRLCRLWASWPAVCFPWSQHSCHFQLQHLLLTKRKQMDSRSWPFSVSFLSPTSFLQFILTQSWPKILRLGSQEVCDRDQEDHDFRVSKVGHPVSCDGWGIVTSSFFWTNLGLFFVLLYVF